MLVESWGMSDTGLQNDPGPKKVTVAGMGESEEHPLADQIALDRYNRANQAGTTRGGFFGIRRVKFRPHGAVLPPGRNGGG